MFPTKPSDVKKKNYPCKYYILSQCTSRNCKFSHDNKMRLEFSKNPCCPNFKISGTCKFDSNCIFVHFHQRCQFFQKNQCTKLNCSYYHDPASIINEFLTKPETIKTLKNQFITEFEKKLKINEKKQEMEKNDRNCVICMVEKADHAALPCGHVNYCSKCSLGLEKCAICRKEIAWVQKVYMN